MLNLFMLLHLSSLITDIISLVCNNKVVSLILLSQLVEDQNCFYNFLKNKDLIKYKSGISGPSQKKYRINDKLWRQQFMLRSNDLQQQNKFSRNRRNSELISFNQN